MGTCVQQGDVLGSWRAAGSGSWGPAWLLRTPIPNCPRTRPPGAGGCPVRLLLCEAPGESGVHPWANILRVCVCLCVCVYLYIYNIGRAAGRTPATESARSTTGRARRPAGPGSAAAPGPRHGGGTRLPGPRRAGGPGRWPVGGRPRPGPRQLDALRGRPTDGPGGPVEPSMYTALYTISYHT
jgi:hypothetical protein